MVKKVTTERAAVRVARNIVQDIQDRELRPGAPLDPEHVMVKNLGVARATVREALHAGLLTLALATYLSL